jgi:hypothetical protein
MRYIFTTLAIGQSYLNKAKQFSHDLYQKDNKFSRVIVSDIEDDNIPNTSVVQPPQNMTYFICNYFNYNLKYLAIKEAYNFDTDYIIYIDSDWEIFDQYHSSKIDKFLDHNPLDFYFERPHSIGASKRDLGNCFWQHKIEPYKLFDTDFYDHAHVCNEQFLIFKKTDKLKTFIDAWEQRNQFGIDNNVWAFAEGLEIGMSSVDAGLSSEYTFFSEIHNCFKFNDISGNTYIRF